MTFYEFFFQKKYVFIAWLMLLIAGTSFLLTMLLFFLISDPVAMQMIAKHIGIRLGTFGFILAYLIFVQIFLVLSALYSANFLFQKISQKHWILSTIILLLMNAITLAIAGSISQEAMIAFFVGAVLYAVLGFSVFYLFVRLKKLSMRPIL